ncbi:MAG TPA: CHAD domain-containing protein [Pseudonocardiaceae bacterium]|jgi:CHAD domain-containing protein|nr:CHAD domain-containing protein [Pseudonocardiaceae bacterium]
MPPGVAQVKSPPSATRSATETRRTRPLTPAQLGLDPEPRAVRRRDDLSTHVRAVLDGQLRELLAHQRDAGNAEEPEAVHQMRVAGRRMRVALRIAGPVLGEAGEQLRAELGWLGAMLGPVRDLDVLHERLVAEDSDLADTDPAGFAEVLTTLRAARASGGAELVTALAGRRYRTLLRGLAGQARIESSTGPEMLAGPAGLVRGPVRKLRRQVTDAGRHPSEGELHELRIRGKRVRYAAEFAAALAGRRDRARLRELGRAARAFQEVLGEHQDTVAAEQRLRELARDTRAGLSADAQLVVGRLIERESARRDQHRARWLPAWRAMDRTTRVLGH